MISLFRWRVLLWDPPWLLTMLICMWVTSIFNSLKNTFLPNIIIWQRHIDGGVMPKSSRHSMLFLNLVLIIWDLLCNLTRVKSVSLIFCEDNVLYTDLYRKPTDRNSLLRADSCHPLPLKNSLPYSQFCRIKIIQISTEIWLSRKENSRRGDTKLVRLILPLRNLKTRHGLFKVSLAKRSSLAF